MDKKFHREAWQKGLAMIRLEQNQPILSFEVPNEKNGVSFRSFIDDQPFHV